MEYTIIIMSFVRRIHRFTELPVSLKSLFKIIRIQLRNVRNPMASHLRGRRFSSLKFQGGGKSVLKL